LENFTKLWNTFNCVRLIVFHFFKWIWTMSKNFSSTISSQDQLFLFWSLISQSRYICKIAYFIGKLCSQAFLRQSIGICSIRYNMTVIKSLIAIFKHGISTLLFGIDTFQKITFIIIITNHLLKLLGFWYFVWIWSLHSWLSC